jgi:hypothetical protein
MMAQGLWNISVKSCVCMGAHVYGGCVYVYVYFMT